MTITEVIQQLEAQSKRVENMMNDSDIKLVDVFAELQRLVFIQTQVAMLLKKVKDDAKVINDDDKNPPCTQEDWENGSCRVMDEADCDGDESSMES